MNVSFGSCKSIFGYPHTTYHLSNSASLGLLTYQKINCYYFEMENSRFPNRLKRYRRIYFFSQQEVACLLGLKDTSPLSKWEKGISFPNLIYLFRLCRIYKTLPSELYVELWQNISNEMAAKEIDLLAQQESVTSNQTFYI